MKKGGGYDNYSIRAATLVEGYFPGPGRSNLLMDPDKALGKYDPGTFAVDELMTNGPGTIEQALPDASRFQNKRIFEAPTGNPYREFAVDNRQIASYQVEQLKINPLSAYSNNYDGEIPQFECYNKPTDYSNMVYSDDHRDFFENFTPSYLNATDVYQQYTGEKVNPNASIVYNLSMNDNTNPLISMGAPTKARNRPDFEGKCYSGEFNRGYLYNDYEYRERTQFDLGIQNKDNKGTLCVQDRASNFANPLILNYFN